MFVTKGALEKEKSHIEGFAAEVAWITRAGQHELHEPIAIRPTSEAIIYPSYARWISSHRDLPLMLNQWNSVVRWEFDRPMPFLRSREFLWQEGHSAFANREEAEEEAILRLDTYRRAYEDLLAVSIIPGKKHSSEKFAGAEYTLSVETVVPETGRCIQAATSHHLGQIFSKMFDIRYEKGDQDTEREYVWQNSWGFSTRSLGVMVMAHGDDKGLVLPPKVAPIQVVIVPIAPKGDIEVIKMADRVGEELKSAGLRVQVDKRDASPGFKFNHWDLKGVPLRIDIGLRELQSDMCTLTRRDNGEKLTVSSLSDPLHTSIIHTLESMHKDMLEKSKAKQATAIANDISSRAMLEEAINNQKVALVQWCGEEDCRESIKAR